MKKKVFDNRWKLEFWKKRKKRSVIDNKSTKFYSKTISNVFKISRWRNRRMQRQRHRDKAIERQSKIE